LKEKVIRASYNEQTITVYQAYNRSIALSASKNQKFISPPFKLERMTWIKPSFLWMMYRSGWATKENQEHILSVQITREGFEWALAHSCLSHFESGAYNSYDDWKTRLYNSPVRIQWDPEKDIFLNKLDYRSIQIGLNGIAVQKYVNEWTVSIEDITPYCKNIYSLILNKEIEEAYKLLPEENIYPVNEELRKIIQGS
jgi:hypothetical protein